MKKSFVLTVEFLMSNSTMLLDCICNYLTVWQITVAKRAEGRSRIHRCVYSDMVLNRLLVRPKASFICFKIRTSFNIYSQYLCGIFLPGVGFEPTPPIGDQILSLAP